MPPLRPARRAGRAPRAAAHQRRAPADPGRGADRHEHGLAAGHRARLVWRRRSPRRVLLGDRRVAPQRHAGRADPLGAVARSLLGRFEPQALLCTDPTRSRCRSSAGSCSAGRSRSPSTRRATIWVWRPSGNGPTGHRPHHALPARAVLHRHPVGGAARPSCPAPGLATRLVSQAAADLRRYPGRRTATDLEGAGFPCPGSPTTVAKLPPALREGIAYALCHAA